MRLSLRLIFAFVLVCSASAWPSTPGQGQTSPGTSPDENKQEPSQPATNPPVETAPPAANNPASPTTTGNSASASPKPPILKHRKRKTHRSSSAKASVSNSGSDSKVVVRNGGAKEDSAQLAPAVNPVQAKSQRANTASLLAATDANLKRVTGRQLTPAQQSMVDEITSYMRQAKAAEASADTNRAQTLAYKARLLSEELARK
ncbi:MAG TPA: hypothetical protein VHQ22_00345 [Terriglobales bacterium]|nr:hypothetical protein [Terriglobales bacterium]